MTNVTTARIAARFADRVRNYANASIAWGDNNMPGGAKASWFGGSNAGINDTASSFDLRSVTSLQVVDITESVTTTDGKTTTTTTTVVGQETRVVNSGYTYLINAANVVSGMQAHLNVYSRIQRVRILLYRSKTGYSNNTAALFYNATANANLADDYRMNSNIADGTLTRGDDIEWTDVEEFINRCRNRIASLKGNTQRTLSNTVCHDSCHSNCHSNRSRR